MLKIIEKDNYLLSIRIKGEDRQKWIPIIAAQQRLKKGKSIYICDLHFDPNDLVKNGKTLRPKKNILPRMRYILRKNIAL